MSENVDTLRKEIQSHHWQNLKPLVAFGPGSLCYPLNFLLFVYPKADSMSESYVLHWQTRASPRKNV